MGVVTPEPEHSRDARMTLWCRRLFLQGRTCDKANSCQDSRCSATKALLSTMKRLITFLLVPLVLVALLAGYLTLAWNWSYSSGERAGWVQKLSKKGWFCKTWEGELALVSMPGAPLEKFTFTVVDEQVAESINRVMGRRVALHYEQKVGLPSTCFGDTRYYITRVTLADDISLSPGVVVRPQQPDALPAPTAPTTTAPAASAP